MTLAAAAVPPSLAPPEGRQAQGLGLMAALLASSRPVAPPAGTAAPHGRASADLLLKANGLQNAGSEGQVGWGPEPFSHGVCSGSDMARPRAGHWHSQGTQHSLQLHGVHLLVSSWAVNTDKGRRTDGALSGGGVPREQEVNAPIWMGWEKSGRQQRPQT